MQYQINIIIIANTVTIVTIHPGVVATISPADVESPASELAVGEGDESDVAALESEPEPPADADVDADVGRVVEVNVDAVVLEVEVDLDPNRDPDDAVVVDDIDEDGEASSPPSPRGANPTRFRS